MAKRSRIVLYAPSRIKTNASLVLISFGVCGGTFNKVYN